LARFVRAVAAASETTPLPRAALLAAALTLLAPPAVAPYLGAARTLLVGALLAIPWIVVPRREAGAVAAAGLGLAVGAALFALHRDHLQAPLSVKYMPNRTMDAVEGIVPGAGLCAQACG